jgi:hypothetical protein
MKVNLRFAGSEAAADACEDPLFKRNRQQQQRYKAPSFDTRMLRGQVAPE